MAFDFDSEYLKESIIHLVDALSWLKFDNEKKINNNNWKDKILYR